MRQSSGILVLPVEHRRELMRGPAERGMVDDVVDPLVSEPHLALARLQTLEELLTRARAHAAAQCDSRVTMRPGTPTGSGSFGPNFW